MNRFGKLFLFFLTILRNAIANFLMQLMGNVKWSGWEWFMKRFSALDVEDSWRTRLISINLNHGWSAWLKPKWLEAHLMCAFGAFSSVLSTTRPCDVCRSHHKLWLLFTWIMLLLNAHWIPDSVPLIFSLKFSFFIPSLARQFSSFFFVEPTNNEMKTQSWDKDSEESSGSRLGWIKKPARNEETKKRAQQTDFCRAMPSEWSTYQKTVFQIYHTQIHERAHKNIKISSIEFYIFLSARFPLGTFYGRARFCCRAHHASRDCTVVDYALTRIGARRRSSSPSSSNVSNLNFLRPY
jgi:hypothetical protein